VGRIKIIMLPSRRISPYRVTESEQSGKKTPGGGVSERGS